LDGASEMRVRLHRTQNPEELIQSVSDFLEDSTKSEKVIM